MTENGFWDSADGMAARRTMFRLLAATGPSATADFAVDVVAGHRAPHDLLTFGPAVEELTVELDGFPNAVDRMSPVDRAMLAERAPDIVRRVLDELVTMDVDAAEAELRELAAPAPEPPRSRPADEDDWAFDQGVLVGR